MLVVFMGAFVMGLSWYMIHLANEADSPGVPSSIWTQTK
jgi:hypothetical protein